MSLNTKPSTNTTMRQSRPVLDEEAQKMVNIKSGKLGNRVNSLEQVLDNMSLTHGTGLMLGGNTGIGKTTFVKQLGKILGMNVVVIEAPHITEEHLINIPFITFEPVRGAGRTQTDVLDTTNFNVTLAKSHLASVLRSAQPIDDATYMNSIKNSNANIKSIYAELGGNETTIPDEIKNIRHKHKVILFLDEYFRQTSANVRNILRGILNGRIGNDRMPPGVYTIYASNLTDVGQTIEQIPMNADFKMVDYKPPTKDEFFHYLISKFEKDTNVKLNPAVVNAFHAGLNDKHISYDDLSTEIRTSPRRWEQIILYINANIPVKTEQDAKALLSNVKANFSNETETSELHKLIDDIVRQIMKDTGSAKFANTKPLDDSQWRETLEHQIETKIKLGDNRSYIPVVMGAPGIGKTKQMADVAHKMNLRLIPIDASTLTAEDITGIPIPNRSNTEESIAESAEEMLDEADLSVAFAEPALYQRIMNDIKDEDERFMTDPNVPAEKKKQYSKQQFKYLIFFDELNRVANQKVFNSLRRVILDKSFNDEYKLPDSAIITAAMNPGDKGTAELTGHLKDAVDLIDAHPSWKEFMAWLREAATSEPNLEQYSTSAKVMAEKILVGFADTFALKNATKSIGADALPFHIIISGSEEDMYISPREYWTMYCDVVAGINRTLKKDSGQEGIEKSLYKSVMQKLESTLGWIMKKHEIESPQLMLAVASWLEQTLPQFMVKQRSKIGLAGMFDVVLADHSKHLKDDPDFVNYTRSFDLNRFNEDITAYIDQLASGAERRIDLLAKDEHSAKELVNGQINITNGLVSKIEYIVKEIRMAAEVNELSNDVVDGLEAVIVSTLQNDLVDEELPDDVLQKLLDKVHAIFA